MNEILEAPEFVASLMREAAQQLGEVMSGMDWQAPDRRVIQNADASVSPDTQAIRDALVRQLYLPASR